MKVLLTGATGYIGSAVTEHLTAAGHQVVALTRDAEPQAGRAWHAQLVGDTADAASLAGAVTSEIEAVIHLAPPSGDADVDTAVIEALAAPLRGTGRPFVYTSGVWVLGATGDAPLDEDAPTNAIAIVGYRPRIEQRVLAEVAEDVRAVVVRPGIVYGRGGGIPGLMTDWAREHGTGRYVGSAASRWPMVHVDDLAELFVLAATKADAGSVLHGVAHEAVPVAALAAAADIAAGGTGRAEPWPMEQAAEAVGGPFAEALGLNQVVSGRRALAELGWRPSRPYVLTELTGGDRG
ncbi:nucleoside-diphosphate-sugar epimerase [Streptomyces sp. 1114.5]|uniref:NAD-dependent epimerase/dehydratase family protein n=1 Tax=unclassified Streptomyces TaxID=2593676 RepID=UPI000BD28A88|nr:MULTISPECIES: NAD-dependent epimerase/dehydratase family protein [unclassified Streptomyces]RKT19514.1 nucleoside-diphosphate-sugar epimerase [Streptomyces sp. 1114.5]SOB85710.1 Nucleoside-diphosphate-sugar epimerase [Streptomyces sp. 1331.2]